MRLAEADFLIVPGIGNSGAGHWQTRWQTRFPSALRVEQENWDVPDVQQWPARLVEAVAARTRPVVLVAHDCGVPTILLAAPFLAPNKVRGAYLVACPDVERGDLPAGARALAPMPTAPLPFPSLLVASRDDPYCSLERAQGIALDIGAALVDAGNAGHIDAESGHGPWPEGLMRLAAFLKGL